MIDADLARCGLGRDPLVAFAAWSAEARAAAPSAEPVMALATATPDGRPSVRQVVLRHVMPPDRFVFYTSTESRKARELVANPWAALNFYWPQVHRQVRVEGPVNTLAPESLDELWATRPREEQLPDLIAQPTEEAPSREAIAAAYTEAERTAGAGRPATWTAFQVRPLAMEFWRADDPRLHDRFRYKRDNLDAPWHVARLWP